MHVDLDQFIAAVEVLRHPELRGRPVVVGGDGDPTKRGVVSTASYEAREHGVHSGLPLRTAAKRLPDAVFLPVDREAYEEVSETVMEVLRASGAVVEVLGWDEAFLGVDVDDPEGFARSLARRVREETQLDCTVGIGENKLQAKIATGFGKPAGVFRLTFANWFEVLGARPTEALWGIGAKTAKKLAGLGIGTVSELAAADPDALAAVFGPMTGPWLVLLARGRGDAEVDDSPYVARGHGREETFQRNIADWSRVEAEVARIAGLLALDLASEPRPALRIVVKVRYAPFITETHGVTLAAPSSDPAVVARAAAEALSRFTGRRPVRLLGVRAQFERGARLVRRTTFSGRGGSAVAIGPAQPVLGCHPDHDLGAAGVGRDVGVATLGSQVPAGQLEPFGVGGVLDDDRALDRDVLVGRPLVLGAQADPARRLDGQGLAGAAAGAHVHRAARPVGVPDRGSQRAAAVR
jgi:DNA polymerase IV